MQASLAHTTAVVLAGGFGTRIRHLAPDLPKPMIAACGRPFLEWVVRYLQRQGIREVILSTGFLGEVIEKHFAAQPVAGVRVTCARETEPLGTGGGFLHAAHTAKSAPETWLVLNGDSMVFADLAHVAAPLANPAVQGVVLGVAMDDVSRYGTLRSDGAGRLLSFDEKRPGAGVINAGIYFFRHALLAEFPAARPLSFETGVFPHLLARGVRLDVSATDAPFLDIGTPESLAQAERFIAENRDRIAG
ncbi:MAG: nucleotidyltransferase family protein [Verrucomicrobia bacterium]|nr:nucleotidyltransferase family protein [Verrucomicrobiota bacterium]